MTETQAEYATKTERKVVEWHCVTDKHGEGCGIVLGHIVFEPTRLEIRHTRKNELRAIIHGDAEIRCPLCGKWQDWHWEREHPLTRRLNRRAE